MNKYQSILTNRKFVTAYLTEYRQQLQDLLEVMQELKATRSDFYDRTYCECQDTTFILWYVLGLHESITKVDL